MDTHAAAPSNDPVTPIGVYLSKTTGFERLCDLAILALIILGISLLSSAAALADFNITDRAVIYSVASPIGIAVLIANYRLRRAHATPEQPVSILKMFVLPAAILLAVTLSA
jgi:hypothetical protein